MSIHNTCTGQTKKKKKKNYSGLSVSGFMACHIHSVLVFADIFCIPLSCLAAAEDLFSFSEDSSNHKISLQHLFERDITILSLQEGTWAKLNGLVMIKHYWLFLQFCMCQMEIMIPSFLHFLSRIFKLHAFQGSICLISCLHNA